jgi:hypothetical protein
VCGFRLLIVEYDKVITNVGNAYDSRHGHFISPVKGVYLMSFTAKNRIRGAVDIEMVRNGVRVAHSFGGSTLFNIGTSISDIRYNLIIFHYLMLAQ